MKSFALLALLCLALAPSTSMAQDPDPEYPPPAETPQIEPETDPYPPPTDGEEPDDDNSTPEPPPPIDEVERLGIVRGLTWDILSSGIPASAALIQVELGFSALPRIAYHYSLARDLSIGGLVAFDYGYWAPSVAWSSNLVLAVPIRYALVRSESWGLAVRAEPGVALGFSPGLFGFQGSVGIHLGFAIETRFVAGVAIESPLLLGIPTDGGSVFVQAPILGGPFLEFHVTPPLAVTLDFRMGPVLNSEVDTVLGLRALGGVTYRL